MGTRIIVERDVEVSMRDGVILRADVYRTDVDDARKEAREPSAVS